MHWRFLVLLTLFVSFLPGQAATGFSGRSNAPTGTGSVIESFDFLTLQSGWVQADKSIFWTDDAGSSWFDITPPAAVNGHLLATTFADQERGWVLFDPVGNGEGYTLRLARTSSGGKLWRVIDPGFFSQVEAGYIIEAGFLHFINRNIGWLVLQSASSSNFKDGYLFKTENGGLTWQKLEIPIAEPVYFITTEVGWTSGGPDGQDFYRSIDGGQTWHPQYIVSQLNELGTKIYYQNPIFFTEQTGLLPLVIESRTGSKIQVYYTEDGGVSWKNGGEDEEIQAIDPSIEIPFSSTGDEKAVMVHPDTGNFYQVNHNAEISISLASHPVLPAINLLDMVSPTTGWARVFRGKCENVIAEAGKPKRSCASTQVLLRTSDAGRSWESLVLPAQTVDYSNLTILPVQPPGFPGSLESHSISSLGNMTSLTAGQGIDKCEIPTPDKLQAWIRYSPYDTINLYIGGATRSCSNLALNAAYISLLSQQGWKFIPTWVGPQASCYSRSIAKMSADPVVSRQQGIAEADAAIEKAFLLGLTKADKSGAVLYYDLENYDRTNASCHTAAKAFIEGWSSQLRLRGNIAGVYSLGPILNDFYSLPQKPDVIWPAHWRSSTYNPDATVWDVYQLSNSYWNNHQRIRQYAGGHSETWGEISITVDSNVLDGVTATGPLQEDANDDGWADLYAVQKSGGSSGTSEIFILDGKSNFGSYLVRQPSALSWTNDQWSFDLADFNNDAAPDLFAIHHYATSSGEVEIRILSGSSAYQSDLLNTPTSLPQSTPGSWVFQAGNYDLDGIPDLYAIDRQGHNTVYVRVLSGASGYQTELASLPTILSRTGNSGAWAYTLADYDQDHISDLVAINKSLGSSSSTELTILSGADNFQSYLFNAPSGLAKTGSDNSWVFFMRDHNSDGAPDLFAVNKTGGIQGKTAAYILDGASWFTTYLLSVPTALPLAGSDCNWDFLSGQCFTTNPVVQYKYYFPLAYR